MMAHRSNRHTTGTPPSVPSDVRARGAPTEPEADDRTRVDETEARATTWTEDWSDERPGDDALDESRELSERAKEKSHELRTNAEEKARELGSMARQKVEEAGQAAGRTVADGASRAGERLRSVAGALLAASDRLDEDGEGRLAEYARETASQVDRMCGYLGERDAGRMVSDLEEKARANPGMFVGGTMASGFAVGRFLRASGRRSRSRERAAATVPSRAEDTFVPPATPIPGAGGVPHEHGPVGSGSEPMTGSYAPAAGGPAPAGRPETRRRPAEGIDPTRPGGAGAP